jgi:hypothetical protein
MIDPQKIPYIGLYDDFYHIYDNSDGSLGRCGANPPTYESFNNRSWRPNLSHIIRMAGHDEMADRIYGKSICANDSICKTCLASAQSSGPLWHKVLSLPFEKPEGALVRDGHDVRMIKMPKGSLIGWVEHVTKPKYIDRKAKVSPGGIQNSRGRMEWSSGYTTPGFKGWSKTKIIQDGMIVSNGNPVELVWELSQRAAHTTEDEAHYYLYSSEDLWFLADYTAGKYSYAGAWTFTKPQFEVKEMVYDEFVSCGWWTPLSNDEATGDEKACPGCDSICGTEIISCTTLKFNRCIYCKWNTVQPKKPALVLKE